MTDPQKWMDNFTFHARFKPALVGVSPLILMSIYKNFIKPEEFSDGILAIVYIVLLYFLGMISRNLGKIVENNICKKLGGMPTSFLLSYRNSQIDMFTKNRYHRKIQAVLTDLTIPMSEREEEKEENAMQIYNSCINYLRGVANTDKDTYTLVYQELIKYNFWRNLCGLKPILILLYSLLGFREIYLIRNFQFERMILQPYPEYITLLTLITTLIILILFVTRKSVEKYAFEYAKALIEICDNI